MSTRAFASLLALSLAASCNATPDPGDELPIVVPEGKQDNFFSVAGQEYIFEGTSTVTIEGELADAAKSARDARAKELIGLKQISIAWFLTQYLLEKKHDDPNAEFGGMGGIARGGSWEDLNVTAVNATTYEFTFRQIVAGKPELISSLRARAGADGRPAFSLDIGRPSNEEMGQLETNNEWYRNAPWDGWNPDAVEEDQKENITFAIELEQASTDAWFDYDGLFADGKLTVDVHFGWDYHNEFHVKHAKSLFSYLKGKGYTTPEDDFEDLTRASGAFRKTIKADGRNIKVEIRIYYGKAGSTTDPDTAAGGIRMEKDMRNSLEKRDVTMFSGHSGPFYGFALANWRKTDEGDLDDSEMSSATMPADRYQLIFAEGCDTYQIGEAFSQNPAKLELNNLDIITTTQASNASSPAAVKDLIARLTEVNSSGEHRPRTIKSLLTDLESNSSSFEPLYGIHGIDDNPKVHPYANLDNLCEPCESHAECGGQGNRCVDLGDGGACAAACTDDSGCGDGFKCMQTASPSSRVIDKSMCVPADLSCE